MKVKCPCGSSTKNRLKHNETKHGKQTTATIDAWKCAKCNSILVSDVLNVIVVEVQG